jgi:transposase
MPMSSTQCSTCSSCALTHGTPGACPLPTSSADSHLALSGDTFAASVASCRCRRRPGASGPSDRASGHSWGRIATAAPGAAARRILRSTIVLLDERVAPLERDLRHAARDDERVVLLRTIPGVADLLGLTLASEIGDIAPVPTPRKLIGYAGLAPRVHQSGQRPHTGALSKAGARDEVAPWTKKRSC